LHILVVEDERKVGRALQQGLEAESYSVALARTGEEGYFLANSQPFDLIVLDVMLPGRSGLDILCAMRARNLRVPVLLLTARDALDDKVRGLDAGADDYLVKPFAFAELSARIRALLRRGKAETAMVLSLGDLRLDRVTRTVTRGDRALELTAREFEMLDYFLQHQKRVVSREMLARDIWKEAARHTPLDNVIDVHMARLRRKVDEGHSTKLVHTVRGVGFVLKTEGA
jgi:two-component system, OmpR family, copper resistance phosphate regulon response regulator CusR